MGKENGKGSTSAPSSTKITDTETGMFGGTATQLNYPNSPATGKQQSIEELQERLSNLISQLGDLDRQIYALETSYLEDTCTYGNVVHGWDSFVARSNAPATARARRRVRIVEKDRVFSGSAGPFVSPLTPGGAPLEPRWVRRSFNARRRPVPGTAAAVIAEDSSAAKSRTTKKK